MYGVQCKEDGGGHVEKVLHEVVGVDPLIAEDDADEEGVEHMQGDVGHVEAAGVAGTEGVV